MVNEARLRSVLAKAEAAYSDAVNEFVSSALPSYGVFTSARDAEISRYLKAFTDLFEHVRDALGELAESIEVAQPELRKANAKRCLLMARYFRDNPYEPAPDIVAWFEGLAVDFELGFYQEVKR